MTPPADPRERFLESVRGRLTELRDIGRGRELRVLPGIDFSSNDYLGLAQQAQQTSFAGSTGSRLLSGHSHSWEQCEDLLAAWHSPDGTRRALYFPSGYVANEGLLSTLINRQDHVFSDALNHGSIIDGLRLSRANVQVFPHQDLTALSQGLSQAPSSGRRFVVTESLFGMDGDRTDLPEIAAVCQEHGALLIVDEAHATGCYGPTGAGLIEASNTRDQVFASVHTCGKALATHGAYVIVDPEIRDFLVQCCRHFIFTTSLPDAIATATVRNVQKVQNDPKPRELLEKHAAFVTTALLEIFRGRVEFNGQARSNILPILLGGDERASAWATALLEHGLHVPAIRSPAVPDGQAILRISVRADHTKEQLTQLVDAVAALAKSEGL